MQSEISKDCSWKAPYEVWPRLFGCHWQLVVCAEPACLGSRSPLADKQLSLLQGSIVHVFFVNCPPQLLVVLPALQVINARRLQLLAWRRVARCLLGSADAIPLGQAIWTR